jgi:hypothetical protein
VTTQADYRRDEWDLIVGAPGLIALVLIHADPRSEAVAYQQLRTVSAAIAEPATQESPSTLIQSVLGAVRAGQSPLWPTAYPCDLGDVHGWAMGCCRQVAAVLAQKAPEAEADAYTHWLMEVAQRVALVPDGHGRDLTGLAVRDARQQGSLAALAAALDARPGSDGVLAAAKV